MKYKKGDKVVLRVMRADNCVGNGVGTILYTDIMRRMALKGKELTIEAITANRYRIEGWYWLEEWVMPVKEAMLRKYLEEINKSDNQLVTK